MKHNFVDNLIFLKLGQVISKMLEKLKEGIIREDTHGPESVKFDVVFNVWHFLVKDESKYKLVFKFEGLGHNN